MTITTTQTPSTMTQALFAYFKDSVLEVAQVIYPKRTISFLTYGVKSVEGVDGRLHVEFGDTPETFYEAEYLAWSYANDFCDSLQHEPFFDELFPWPPESKEYCERMRTFRRSFADNTLNYINEKSKRGDLL